MQTQSRLILVTGATGRQGGAVAHERGVRHYVYSSVGSADRRTRIPHFDNKYRVEQTVREQSEDFAAMLERFDAVGYDADIPRLAQESGIRPTSLQEWAGTVDWKAPAHV
jgi:uncharacterized protein YbjT (DUF2867 family)